MAENFTRFCEEETADVLPTSAIFRMVDRLDIPFYPEFAEEQANEDANKL